MFQEKLQIVENGIYAFLLANRKTHKIIDSNRLARSFYWEENHFLTLDTLFHFKNGDETVVDGLELLTSDKPLQLWDVISKRVNGEDFSCDMEISMVDEENDVIFLMIKGKLDEIQDEKALHMSEVLDLSTNPVFQLNYDQELSFLYANPQFYLSFSVTHSKLEKTFENSFLQLVHPSKREEVSKTIQDELKYEKECDVDVELTFDGDGEHYRLYRLLLCKMNHAAGDIQLFGVLIAIKKQIELMKKIEYDQQYFDIMQEFSKDLLFRIDIKARTLIHRGDITKFHGLLPMIENYPESMRDCTLIHPDDMAGYITFAYRLMSGVNATYEPRFQFTNGSYEKYRLQGKVLFDGDGNPVQVVGKSENIQKYVDIEARANYDSLTTALNKQSFKELVEDLLARSVERDRFALLFLDFDDFKRVNDEMGHVFGDFLLEVAGKRIINCVRNQDKVGRVGGDEFVIFFHHAPTHEAVQERAEAILASLRRKFNNGDQNCSIRATIGISLFPEHGNTYDLLYHRADKALYEAKALGKDLSVIYSEELDQY